MKRKSQEPRAKIQRNAGKLQAPSSMLRTQGQFGVVSFSGAWCLKFGVLLLVLLGCLHSSARAQTNIPVVSSNRYLFILETSRSMESRANGTRQVIQQLLATGMGGEMRAGDSFGIWTYNSQL